MTKDGAEALMVYLMLLCEAVKADRQGAIMLYADVPYNDHSISGLSGLPIKKIVEIVRILSDFRLITLSGGTYHIADFERYSAVRKAQHVEDEAIDSTRDGEESTLKKPTRRTSSATQTRLM